jgi:ketosteroid isomerase-like protein
MSHENVDVVLGSWKAYADGGLDALAEFWDPDITWRAMEGAPDDVGEMRGADAVRRYVGEWVDMFDDLTIAVQEVRDAGGDRVVSAQRVRGRAKISGVETELGYAIVYTIRDGRIAGGREYWNLEQALEALEA